MNRKLTGILTVLAFSAMSFAQDAAPAAAPAEESAPVAVRGAETAAPAEQAAPVAEAPVEQAAPAAAPVSTVEEPAVVVAPKAVRNADSDADRTAASARAVEQFRDAMDELRGLYPMKLKVGAHGSVGAYQLSGNDWDSDQYSGLSWRAGIMSIIPLNQYTMGIKLGVLYEQSKASESYYVNDVPTNFRFSQKKIDVPVLFTFKAASSRIYFDLGVEMSIPLYDKLRISYTDSKDEKHTSRIDMMDEYRTSADCAFVFGFSVLANDYLSLDVSANLGVSDLYDGHLKYMNLNLDASSLNLGITVYPF